MRHEKLLLALSTAALLGGVACSASDNTSGSGGNGANSTTVGQGGDTTSVGGGSASVGGFMPTGSGGGSSWGCSADLRYVVDGQGTVIEECWPDAGCANGMCVPPCDAASESKGNVGCDFSVATPYFYTTIAPPCFAVFLANNWPKDAQITIERDGQTYDVTQYARIPDGTTNAGAWPTVPAAGLPPNQVAVLFLSQDPSSVNGTPLTCPVPPAINTAGGSAVSGSGLGRAWKITSNIPVSAYDILPYGGASSYLPSAELLAPTTAWGDNYIAVLPPDSSGPPWGQLVAAQDNTMVSVLPSTSLPAAGTVPAAPAGQTTQFTLNAGDYVQWQLSTDMTGTVIQADKPVSFTGGNAYICYSSATSTGGGCDSAHQQIPAIAAQGYQYVAPPYADRGGIPESIPYRLVGAVDGTQLTYDPPVGVAPTTIGAGEVVDFEAIGAFTITSQDEDHPFYVGQSMTGCFTGNNSSLGDEEYVNILPPAQFLKRYVFFTDPTYPTTNLVLTRVKGANGYADVTVDCLGTVGGWQPVGNDDLFEVTNVDLIRNGMSNMGCTNGPHIAESEGDFGVMVWGLDTYSSYAYPAGGSSETINTVVVPPIPQ